MKRRLYVLIATFGCILLIATGVRAQSTSAAASPPQAGPWTKYQSQPASDTKQSTPATSPGRIDVACSADVPPKTCKTVSNIASPLGAIVKNLSIVILTPAEFKERIAENSNQMQQNFNEVTKSCNAQYPDSAPNSTPADELANLLCLHEHFLFLWNPQRLVAQGEDDTNVAFLRADPHTSEVGQILVSTDEFNGIEFVKDSTGRGTIRRTGFDLDEVGNFLGYTMGYLAGITASTWSEGISTYNEQVVQSKENEDLIKQYNKLVDQYNSLLRAAKTLASFPPTFVFPTSVSYVPPPPLDIHCETTNNGMPGMFYKTATTCRQ